MPEYPLQNTLTKTESPDFVTNNCVGETRLSDVRLKRELSTSHVVPPLLVVNKAGLRFIAARQKPLDLSAKIILITSSNCEEVDR